MTELTGYNRAKITALWLQRGKPTDLEKFIKAVCKKKGWKYRPPVKG